MFSQPTSSPMMTMMFGFVSCASALDAGSADAVASAASAVPVVRKVLHKLIASLQYVCCLQSRES